MDFPAELRYTKDHEWTKIDGDTVTIGITDYAQSELGDIIFVELPESGASFSAGESLGTIEAVKTVSDIFAPVSGEIIEVNDALTDSPEIINSDCYGDGWMIKMKISDSTELDGLLSADKYQETIE